MLMGRMHSRGCGRIRLVALCGGWDNIGEVRVKQGQVKRMHKGLLPLSTVDESPRGAKRGDGNEPERDMSRFTCRL